MNPPEQNRQNWLTCSHCQCSTLLIGSKLLTDCLNVGPDISPDVNAKPTIFEALTLIFGFQLPPPEVSAVNTATGIQYFVDKGDRFRHLVLCVNCESVLTNLYKVFLLFTELSNGKESFILKHSIISGRLEKEEEVIPLDRQSRNPSATNKSHSVLGNSSDAGRSVPIRRELTSEVIAEMFVPNTISVSITPTSSQVQNQNRVQKLKTMSNISNNSNSNQMPTLIPQRAKNKSLSVGKSVEVITLDEDDESTGNQTASVVSHNGVHQTNPNLTRKSIAKNKSTPSTSHSQSLNSSPNSKRSISNISTTGANSQTTRGVTDPSQLSISTKRKGLVTTVTSTTSSHRCDLCLLYFNSVELLLAHLARDHVGANVESQHLQGSRPTILSCRRCSRKFSSTALLETHMRYHNKSTLFKCFFPSCTKSYYELRLLRRHQTMANHAPPPSTVSQRHRNMMNNLISPTKTSSEVRNDEEDYWKSGIQVIHDPDQVMKRMKTGGDGPEKKIETS